MAGAAQILGTEVGSTVPVFLAFLTVHVLAGLTAVVTGAIAALARKGTLRHIHAGRWYYRAISIVFVAALALTAMRPREDYHLAAIGLVALHRRSHRLHPPAPPQTTKTPHTSPAWACPTSRC